MSKILKLNCADRISTIKPYFFSTLGKEIDRLRAQGQEIIRIDIGSPDLPPSDFIIDELIESAREANNHGYAPNGGTKAFKNAICTYYKKRFGVTLDSESEVLGLVGSKEGIFDLSQVILDKGDVALVPDPGYPVYKSGTEIAGAEVYSMPLLEENNFLPDFDAIPNDIRKRAKLMWLNYPNNPTGAIATYEFFQKAVDFANKHQILIAHDAPYTDICYNGYTAPSILEIPGAKEICVEFNSLSKTYNMAGWRLGMVVGKPEIIQYISTFQSQMDTSQFKPIFSAGVKALTGEQNWIHDRNAIYKERLDLILETLKQLGFTTNTPPAAIYVWAKIPKEFTDCEAFCDRILHDTGVSITPGTVYGKHGKGFVRISIGAPTETIKLAMKKLTTWINQNR